jgi:hypothetical protein
MVIYKEGKHTAKADQQRLAESAMLLLAGVGKNSVHHRMSADLNRWGHRTRRCDDMSTALKPTAAVDQFDLIRLSSDISALMLGYCDAIGACRSIPTLSLLPLPKLYVQFFLWLIALELCFLLVPIDLCLFLARRMFGRPRLVLGRVVYTYLAKPLRSAWDGEISAFKILRMRYLTRLLLFYRAQSKINALHSVFNRRHLDLLFANPPNDAAVSDAEKFQKSFDLFQKITTDSYQIGALAIGGPFVALLTITVQKGLLPFASFLWGYFGGPTLAISNSEIGTLAGFFAIFPVVMIWILVSAWMDMRSVVVGLGVPKIERHAYAYARIRVGRQIPFDILLYFGLIGCLIYGLYGVYMALSAMEDAAANHSGSQERLLAIVLEYATMIACLLCLGLIALARRLWLSRETVPSADIDLVQ